MSWSRRKKAIYILIFAAAAAVIISLFFIDFSKPTCNDGKRNQEEEGIDCGGPCVTVCRFSAKDLVVRWNRAFEIKKGIYNAVAYINNPNNTFDAENVPYIFKLYDKDNILVYERKGRAYIPPQNSFAIFESSMDTGNRIPQRTTFEFALQPGWKRSDNADVGLKIKNVLLKKSGEEEKSLWLEADIENTNLDSVNDIELVAILYDKDGNSINSSETLVDFLRSGSERNMTFTWPNMEEASVLRVEIVPVSYKIVRD